MASDPETVIEAPVETTLPRRAGFLPIVTNAFDRGFIGVVLFVAIHLLWLRFIEPLGLSLYIATVLSIVLGVIIVRRG